MAQWKPTPQKAKTIINRFGDGLNVGQPPLSIGENELTHMQNMDSEKYPAITVRHARKARFTKQDGFCGMGTGYSNKDYLVIATSNAINVFSESGGSTSPSTPSSSLNTSSTGSFASLPAGANDYMIFMNSDRKKVFQLGTTAVNISDTNLPSVGRKPPLCGYKGRVFVAAFGGKTLYYSALNNPLDWTTANDAGSIIINFAILALFEYNNNIYIFSYSSIYILRGSGPDDFAVELLTSKYGCINQSSVTICDDKLYFIDSQGIYEHNGVTITRISDQLKSFFSTLLGPNSFIASVDQYVYASYYPAAEQRIAKYNTKHHKWTIETGTYKRFCNVNNKLLGIDGDNNILEFRTTNVLDITSSDDVAGTPIPWSFVTKPYTEGSMEQKTLSQLDVMFELSTSSTAFKVQQSTDALGPALGTFTTNYENAYSTAFTDIFSTNLGSTSLQNRKILVPHNMLQNVPWYRLRFAGSGPATIHQIQKTYRVKRR